MDLMEMDVKRLEAAIEAILFTMGESVEAQDLAKAISQDVPTTKKLIRSLMDRYQGEEYGLEIIELEGAYQMCTKKQCYEYLINIAVQPKKAALTDVRSEERRVGKECGS